MWSVQGLDGLTALRARITVPRVAQKGQWAPLFRIELRGDGDKNAVTF